MFRYSWRARNWAGTRSKSFSTETLVDSIYVVAVSADKGQTFTIRTNKKDVDGDGDIDRDDKAKLIALAKAYVAIINP